MQKKIVIITTGQPSTNPRLQKEVAALVANSNYQLTVLYSFWAVWADAFDAVFFRRYPTVLFVRVGGHPEHEKISYQISRAFYKAARILSGTLPKNTFLKRCTLSRTAYPLQLKARTIPAHLYIAHNLGAIPAAVYAAKKHGAKCSADLEDFYSGQWPEGSAQQTVSSWAEQTFLPQLNGYTTSSPLIAQAYKKLAAQVPSTQLLNVFPKVLAAQQPCPYRGQLKLFWTSQTVGTNRGLEKVIVAMATLPAGSVSLTIVGSFPPETKAAFVQLAEKCGMAASQLSFLSPLPLEELFMMAAQHHIGIAIETENSVNRQICLTNKLFTYLLAGLAIVANNTQGQQRFFDTCTGIGTCYDTADDNALSKIFQSYLTRPERLISQQQAALQLAITDFNWDVESAKFISHTERLLA